MTWTAHMIKIGFKLDILELGLETQLSFRERIAPVFLGAVLTTTAADSTGGYLPLRLPRVGDKRQVAIHHCFCGRLVDRTPERRVHRTKQGSRCARVRVIWP
eukprot:1779623-Rhodomonas_salina.2